MTSLLESPCLIVPVSGLSFMSIKICSVLFCLSAKILLILMYDYASLNCFQNEKSFGNEWQYLLCVFHHCIRFRIHIQFH